MPPSSPLNARKISRVQTRVLRQVVVEFYLTSVILHIRPPDYIHFVTSERHIEVIIPHAWMLNVVPGRKNNKMLEVSKAL